MKLKIILYIHEYILRISWILIKAETLKISMRKNWICFINIKKSSQYIVKRSEILELSLVETTFEVKSYSQKKNQIKVKYADLVYYFTRHIVEKLKCVMSGSALTNEPSLVKHILWKYFERSIFRRPHTYASGCKIFL